MGKFQYEWWDVESKEPAGKVTLQCKAKSREHAVKQFKKWYKNDPLGIVGEIDWNTLRMDHKGYQRLF